MMRMDIWLKAGRQLMPDYFDNIYGTMAKGEVIIDGVSYYFDVDTGILQ